VEPPSLAPAGLVEMAVLVEGQKFGLSSKSEKSKSVVFVKLTDSSLKSLEDYLKHRGVFDKSEQGPTISFTADNRGEITLPSTSNSSQVSYSFGIKRENEGGSDKQGSFDCISGGTSSQSSLQSMGTIREKLHVQASNDVYERIGQRIQDAKIQEEKRSTVLLDDKKDKKSSTIPKQNVVRKPPGRTVPPPRPAPARQSIDSAIPNLSGSSWSGPGRGGARTAHPSSANTGEVKVHPKKPSSPSKGGSVRPPSPGKGIVKREPLSSSPPAKHHPPKNNYSQQHPQRITSTQAKPAPPIISDPCPKREKSHSVQKPSINPEIMKRPLRERLIHLLAVRPYKKPELLLRITKDGIKEKEKKNITNMLKSIVFMKDNSFHLNKHLWNEVREDWPFFSEEERNMLKRRKPQNLTPESDTGSTSSGHSPSSTNPASPPQITGPSLKRHSYYDTTSDPNPKKKRVSMFKRDIGPGSLSGFSRSPDGEISPPSLGSRSPPRTHEWGDEGYAATPGPVVGRSPVRQSPAPRCSPAPPTARTSSPHQPDPPAIKIEQGESEGENHENSQSQPQLQKPVDNKNKDFVTAYTTILSVEQRMKYKLEFNEHYNNYRKLHSILDRVSKRFSELENNLKLHPRDSPEFKHVQTQIVSEYAKNKQDADYQNARHLFQYLHEKLAHIKLLVHNYDTNAVPR